MTNRISMCSHQSCLTAKLFKRVTSLQVKFLLPEEIHNKTYPTWRNSCSPKLIFCQSSVVKKSLSVKTAHKVNDLIFAYNNETVISKWLCFIDTLQS